MSAAAWALIGSFVLFCGTALNAVLLYRSSRKSTLATQAVEEKKQRLDEIDQIIKGQSAYIHQLESRLDSDRRWFDAEISRMMTKLERCELDKERLKVRVEALEARNDE